MSELEGYFIQNYGPLKGRDWLRRLPKWERSALSRVAWSASDYGKSGGVARAQTALRDRRGRFIKNKEIA